MKIELTAAQVEAQENFREFVEEEIVPKANEYDQKEYFPPDLIEKIAKKGYLGAVIPKEYGGKEWDMITFGLLCKEIGRGSASMLSLFTVHGMNSIAIMKWGTPDQKKKWLPQLAAGDIIGAFALTEPEIGSDAKNINTAAEFSNGAYSLSGKKKWISCGQIADLFLIFGKCKGKSAAFLVEKDNPGFSTKPMSGLLGFRSAMLAELSMEDCVIPEDNLLGKIGFGLSHVAGSALDLGRYCVATGSVGLAQACLEASLKYTNERIQFGTYLKEHQLIQQMIADMISEIKAAELICYSAGYLKDIGDPGSVLETSIAKYFCSKTAVKVANDAVQIHGANGCSNEYAVQRHMRDAKILEIIEGSSQIQQMLIARYGYQNWARL